MLYLGSSNNSCLKTRSIGQRCVLSVMRYALCDGAVGGGVGGGGGGGQILL